MIQPHKLRLSQMTPTQVIIFGYIVIILLGAFALCLPISSQARQWTGFVDALFTSTSATCVTGLAVVPTASYWSLFGQLVILLLIQVGGMGFLTMAIMVAIVTKRKIGLRQRFTMQESISAPNLGGIVRLTRFVFRGVLLFEGAGAILLAVRFIPMLGFFRGIYYAVFHSISAFCNAGFDLMSTVTDEASMAMFRGDPLVNFTLMALIVIGGLGFFVWEDLYRCGTRLARCRLHTKIVLTTTAILIVVPAAMMFYFDLHNPNYASYSWVERGFAALFQSVSARTAGFSTVDQAAMAHATQLTMIFLMLAGGSSGSTAGGMKTTTIATLFLCVRSAFTRDNELHAFGRRMDESVLRNAITVFMCYLTLFVGGGFLITHIDQVPMLSALYETASAVATVGLSMNLTDQLSTPSQLILIFLMYFGRVGCLTLVYAFSESRTPGLSRLPLENIAVG